jgi:UPF0755 protein
MRSRTKIRKPMILKLILLVMGILVVASIIVAWGFFRIVLAPNTKTGGLNSVALYIPTGSSYDDVMDSLAKKKILVNPGTFKWLAEKKKYAKLVKPGRYLITSGMSNDRLINKLRSGDQDPEDVIFNNIRTREQLAGVVSKQLEADSTAIFALLNNESYLSKYGLNRYTALTIFIPNTYEFWWNTSAEQFMERMRVESGKFWNQDRTDKASGAGMSTAQVITLASIIEKETNKNDEKARMAGVYVNRLHKGWPLQADPTLVYAVGDFTITRVLDVHKEIDSPYNTYKHTGLPPGPICIPSIASIDAVLNYEKHEYMFFVAKPDMSGYHVFSKTLSEHNRHADRYRDALNASRKKT